MFWCRNAQKETNAMLPSFLQKFMASQKVKETLEKVRHTLELLGMDFSDFYKYHSHRSSKD